MYSVPLSMAGTDAVEGAAVEVGMENVELKAVVKSAAVDGTVPLCFRPYETAGIADTEESRVNATAPADKTEQPILDMKEEASLSG